MSLPRRLITAIPLAALAACGAESSGRDGDLQVTALFDQSSGHVLLQLSRPLDGNERILARTRRGSFGKLDCANTDTSFSQVADTGELELTGPAVDAALIQPFYGPEWAGEPTPEMLAALEKGTDSIIDVCSFDGQRLVASLEVDLFQSWDRAGKTLGTSKKDGPNGETRINSAQEYGVRCVGELGEIPFFQKTGEGAYSTFNCLDATPVPMTVTDANGAVTSPDRVVSKCDKPQYIYSSCEGGPRVATRTNENGTRWTLLCRKSIGGATSSQYNDIAMIGHNPFTGKTCFFQNALYEKKNGAAVPHPADVTKSTNLWSGVHGGLGSGIQCADCHDSDAFIHSPWIDGAKDAQGRPIVPKFGVDLDMPLGANDAPYSIVNLAGQGWTMHKQITSPEVNACARCHRMAGGKWLAWAKRLDGTDTTFKNLTTPAYRTFEKIHWMPPDLTGLNQGNWSTSEFGKALDFLKRCATNRSLCTFADIPTTRPGGGDGTVLRNPVTLEDRPLAMQATALLGVGVPGSQSRCGECHSLTQDGLRTWQTLTETATANCLAETAPGTPVTQIVVADQVIAAQAVRTFGPFDAPVGGTFEARLRGTNDADLYVKRGSAASPNGYDCASTSGTSDEVCGPQQFPAAGPGQFFVAVLGYSPTSTFTLEVAITPPGTARPAADIVSCLHLDPTSTTSPYYPAKAGIYAAAAHLGWFQRIFQAAYPLTTPGNTSGTWLNEYLKFRQRVGMPKGNHPLFTQAELDIVAEWFARGLPLLEEAVPADPPPSTCTPTISADMIAHANQMQTTGWTAVNRDRGMTMFGCAASADPQQCLTALPAAASKPYGAGWAIAGTQVRILRELSFKSFYWMRSSADGRFLANGNSSQGRATISDLQLDKDIPTDASYDPGFFPDNSGFVFQSTPIGTGFCSMNLLTSGPASINFGETQCSQAANIGLYQHLGAGLGGADYFVVNGQFVSDEGGHQVDLEDPIAGFTRETQAILTPLTFNGQQYQSKTPVPVNTPFEGDSILSPSTRLMVNRLAGPFNRQLGFVVRKVNAVPNGNSHSITAPEVARYCVRGSKPSVSFDERFMVYHHYVEENDAAELGLTPTSPLFLEYRTKGASNLYVLDMVTGVTRRVTNMKPGQYALFPHFRSDGWIYAQVRDANTGLEYAIASDAKLVLD